MLKNNIKYIIFIIFFIFTNQLSANVKNNNITLMKSFGITTNNIFVNEKYKNNVIGFTSSIKILNKIYNNKKINIKAGLNIQMTFFSKIYKLKAVDVDLLPTISISIFNIKTNLFLGYTRTDGFEEEQEYSNGLTYGIEIPIIKINKINSSIKYLKTNYKNNIISDKISFNFCYKI